MKQTIGIILIIIGIGIAGIRINEMQSKVAVLKANIMATGGGVYLSQYQHHFNIPVKTYLKQDQVKFGGFLGIIGLIMLFSNNKPKDDNIAT